MKPVTRNIRNNNVSNATCYRALRLVSVYKASTCDALGPNHIVTFFIRRERFFFCLTFTFKRGHP
jgi:hypothetical protein